MAVAPVLPRLEPAGRAPAVPRAVVLVLPGGRAHSHESGERKRLSYWRMVPFARALARHREPAVYLVRYRVRGWNAPDRDALRDARTVVGQARDRHPGVPIVLVGHVLRAAAGGATVADVARSLHLSEGTLRNHLSSAIGKTGARTRAEAVRTADEQGWL